MKNTCVAMIALCAAAALAGCIDSSPEGSAPPGALITPRETWRAYGDLRDPSKAIDGDLGTAAVGSGTYPKATIELDLGKLCLFNRIMVEHGPDEYGFPNRMAVYTSLDGRKFTLDGEFSGKRKVTNALLVTPVVARYVRLQAVSPGLRPWSVAEIVFQ